MASKSKDLKNVAKRQGTFATLAHREGLGARKRAKREAKSHMPISAKDSRAEAIIDEDFAKGRRAIANKAKKAAAR